MDMTPQTWPEWYDGRHINEVLFCQQFLEKHPMKCVRGRLFTVFFHYFFDPIKIPEIISFIQ